MVVPEKSVRTFRREMAQGIEAWVSALFVFCVAAVLGVNAVLLHANSRKANGRLVRPFLRIVTGRPRARSLSVQAAAAEAPSKQRQQRQPSEAERSAMNKISTRSANSGSSSREIWEAAERWVAWDPNSTTRATVQGWIKDGDEVSASR